MPAEHGPAIADARLPVLDRRRAGLLLHLGSLPSERGGALGAAAREAIDWMAQAGFTVWQVLPLGPTGADGSPYWVRSDYAGDATLIDAAELPAPFDTGSGPEALERAAMALSREAPAALASEYRAFLERARGWLDDWALFEALSARFAKAWPEWPAALRDRDPAALDAARREHRDSIEKTRALQFFFDRQWRDLRAHAHERGVRLLGDVPIYVAPDSAETWAHREQFQLDATGRPEAVAGVPPDYFSETGQLWGNPLYDWRRMQQDGFAHWRARLAAQLERVDLLRIDHFRGLAGYWAVPAGAEDARGGEWRSAPGGELFAALKRELGDAPFVAEDLGLITPDVEALREAFELPGMRVLQFAFDGSPDNPHLPYNFPELTVAYTGTHDNDTTLGWYLGLDAQTRERIDFFLDATRERMPEALARATLASVARLGIVPVQDVLGLGAEARLNTPGTSVGNWSWRLPPRALDAPLAQHWARINRSYGRS